MRAALSSRRAVGKKGQVVEISDMIYLRAYTRNTLMRPSDFIATKLISAEWEPLYPLEALTVS